MMPVGYFLCSLAIALILCLIIYSWNERKAERDKIPIGGKLAIDGKLYTVLGWDSEEIITIGNDKQDVIPIINEHGEIFTIE